MLITEQKSSSRFAKYSQKRSILVANYVVYKDANVVDTAFAFNEDQR